MALRVGLIGVGKHGQRYARHIRDDVSEVQLVALARRDATKAAALAAEFGCRPYTDYRELIAAPDVEAVIVVVPPTLHRDVVAAAAGERRAILLEKPAAVNLAVGRELLACTRRAGVPVMVAQTLRYNAVVDTIRAALPTIGAIHSVRVSQRFEPSPLAWLDDPAVSGGGMVLHTGVHMFDLIRLLTGCEAARVSCEMNHIVTQRTEDNFSAVIAMEGGRILASAVGSRATQSRCGGIEVAGQRGALAGDHVLRRAYRIDGTTMIPLDIAPSRQTVPEVLRDFAAALRRGGPMPIPLEEGLRAVAIAEACYRASAAGKAVPVNGEMVSSET
ncbi:MAG TPA: Gfo/Idh/MocA family oxidoreductase [Candidatus Binatia bacterium]|nr:Gfo/Idh/MocA family oxidoreductase [Candidatus Binatia bacterium]